jgi:hypothetical protein
MRATHRQRPLRAVLFPVAPNIIGLVCLLIAWPKSVEVWLICGAILVIPLLASVLGVVSLSRFWDDEHHLIRWWS